MSLAVQLLGRPRLQPSSGDGYRFRSRKSWALLAYLVRGERAPSRSQLASLLFAEADDPIRALRWSLSEIRQGLGDGATLDGDPVVLSLAADTVVDVDVLLHGAWTEAIELPGLGADLLDGVAVPNAPVFGTWLLSEQRHVAAAAEAVLHEAALGSMSRGELDVAVGYAVRAASMSPLDENHQALVIRLYRLLGDDRAAQRQYDACRRTFARELGIAPGAAVQAALRETRHEPGAVDAPTLEALVEAGAVAVAAGARDAGVQSLRTAARLAGEDRPPALRIKARLVLAEALIHALGGLDEEGVAALSEADEIARLHDLPHAVAEARCELGYVDFLRARYDRADLWLTDALARAGRAVAVTAKATTYLGAVDSDRADYGAAVTRLEQAVTLSRVAGDPRREAFALSMHGRIDLLRGDLDAAADRLDASIALAERHHWLAFLPWAQALRGEVQLARGDAAGAAGTLEQAFARACQLGDPCWEGISARGLALVAEARGETDRAFEILSDARVRSDRLADPYVWLDAYILDAQCTLGRRHGHVATPRWVEEMRVLTSRTGMKELGLRSLLHAAALGVEGSLEAATLLTAEIDNPALEPLLAQASRRSSLTAPSSASTRFRSRPARVSGGAVSGTTDSRPRDSNTT